MATQMLMVAMAWHMYELTSSAWDLGLVGLVQFVPALLLALLTGHVADRWPRGRIIVVCLLGQALVAAVLLQATWADDLSRDLLLWLSLVMGAIRAFQMPASQALLPALVSPSLLPRAMAFSSAGLQAAILGGPALGGFVFALGAVVVYALSLALLLVACLALMRLSLPHRQAVPEPMTVTSVLAGVRFVWHNKVLLGGFSLDLFAVLLGGATALLPIYAKDILEVGPWGLGLLRASPAAGALIMSLVLTRWPLQRHVGRWLMVSVGLFGVSIAVFAVSTVFWLSMLALVFSGAFDMVSVVVRQTLMQLETPDEMRGRVSAVSTIFIGASNQLGEFESGATAAWMGPVAAALVGGIGTVVVAVLWTRLFPSLARRDRMSP
ncbi:MAG: MFS transporter [Burkholderiaceae bacterium]|nr:MFS transporter [Burkholderiaceae bacterium]